MRRGAWLVALGLLGCGEGSTGSTLVEFTAFGAGPRGVDGAVTFENDLGYTVTLTQARLVIGGVYLNRNVPLAGAQEQRCILPGLYVGEVTQALELDLLDDSLQAFPAPGVGLSELARSAELWLKDDSTSIDAPDSNARIAMAHGTAERGTERFTFELEVTIGANRRQPDPDPQKPGANPICAERIVSRIPVAITPQEGGSLVVRADPRRWFMAVDFAALRAEDRASDGAYVFPDAPDGQPALTAFTGLKSVSAYELSWR